MTENTLPNFTQVEAGCGAAAGGSIKSRRKHSRRNKSRRKQSRRKQSRRKQSRRKQSRRKQSRRRNIKTKKIKLSGGHKFDDAGPQFKSQLPTRSIDVSEGPIVVSQNVLDIIYNSLNIPSVLYDLLTIFYILKVPKKYISLTKFDINKILKYNPVSKPSRETRLGKKSFTIPTIISIYGLYDPSNVDRLINKKFSQEQEQIDIFINEYITAKTYKGIIFDRNNLVHLNILLDRLENELKVIVENYLEEDWAPYLTKSIKIVRSMKIIELEYEYTIKQKKMIFYKGTSVQEYNLLPGNHSLSFGVSLFAGFFNDCDGTSGASTICYLVENPILSVFIFNPQEQEKLFYFPSIIPLVNLLGQGELFHGRLKIPEGSDNSNVLGISGAQLRNKLVSTKDDAHGEGTGSRYFSPLITSLTQPEIRTRFDNIRSSRLDSYHPVTLELDWSTGKVVENPDYESNYTTVFYDSDYKKIKNREGYIQVYVF